MFYFPSDIMFKTQAVVLCRDLRRVVFWNGLKNIPGKARVKRVHNNDVFVNVGN